MAFYAAVVLYFSVKLGARYGFCHFLLAPVVYLTVHLGLGAGFLVEACRWGAYRKRSGVAVPAGAAGETAQAEKPSSAGS